MKKMNEVSIYKDFKCIADKCKFTCCSGWEVEIDKKTYENLKVHNLTFVVDKIEKREVDEKFFVKKEIEDNCPFLDTKGLCEIVKNNGEEFLSDTCKTFPRIINKFEDFTEMTLSCSCPEVVDIIERTENDIFLKINDISFELKLRNKVMDILNIENIRLDIKLLIGFEMLHVLLKKEESEYNDILSQFSDEYIKDLESEYKNLDVDRYEGIEELNYLFIDIVENYKDVDVLKQVLSDSFDFANTLDIAKVLKKLNLFNDIFSDHEKLLEKCIRAKILSNCVNSDIDEFIIAFEMIILEYVLIKHGVFLDYLINDKNSISNSVVKDYIVAFSRVIGNNIEAVREFLNDGFESDILDISYLSFIALI